MFRLEEQGWQNDSLANPWEGAEDGDDDKNVGDNAGCDDGLVLNRDGDQDVDRLEDQPAGVFF